MSKVVIIVKSNGVNAKLRGAESVGAYFSSPIKIIIVIAKHEVIQILKHSKKLNLTRLTKPSSRVMRVNP